MNAAELREALFWQREIEKDIQQSAPHPDTAEAGISVLASVFDAARTMALPILEADSELVERIKPVIWEHLGPMPRDVLTRFVAALLAAISTPTPVEES